MSINGSIIGSNNGMVTQHPLKCDEELDQLESWVELALRHAKANHATAAEVTAQSSQGLSVNIRMGDVDTLEHTRDRGLAITVYKGRSKGHASSGELSVKGIRMCVERALDIASFTEKDNCNGLAEIDRLATTEIELDLWHPADVTVQWAIERALACEAEGRAEDRITNSEGASFNTGTGLMVYGNSHGFVGRSFGTRFDQSCVLIAGSGSDMQRDYSYDSRRSLDDLESVEATGSEAARRTVSRLGTRRLKTADMPVLMCPRVAKGFIGHLLGAISGSAQYRNASFLKGAAGQVIFPDWMSISERPHLPRGAGSAWFDGDGVQTCQRSIIDQGRLTGYVLSTYSACRLGLDTTANAGGVRNLLVHSGGNGHADPMAEMQDGLYVTEVMGPGVSQITGDYSRGAVGFVVKGGEIQYPVEEITIASNLADMFKAVVATGDDIDTRGNIHTGTILLKSMKVAGE